MKNRLYYLTGYAGSGKSSIALYEYYRLNSYNINTILFTNVTVEERINLWEKGMGRDYSEIESLERCFYTPNYDWNHFKEIKADVVIFDVDSYSKDFIVQYQKEKDIPVIMTKPCSDSFHDQFGSEVWLLRSKSKVVLNKYEYSDFIRDKINNSSNTLVSYMTSPSWFKKVYKRAEVEDSSEYKLNYIEEIKLFIPIEELRNLVEYQINKESKHKLSEIKPTYDNRGVFLGLEVLTEEPE